MPEVRRVCGQAGVAVVVVPEITGCRASGATRWLSPHKAVLQLSVRHKRNDHLWFAFFHELGHILLHGKRDQFIPGRCPACRRTGTGHILLHGKRDQFIEDDRAAEDPKEQQADRFAADTLIPSQYAAELSNLRSLSSITAFADRLGLAPGIVVGRLQRERVIAYNVGHRLFEKYEFGQGVT